MFCPRCGYEYNPGIKTCPDCNIDLVVSLPTEKEKQMDTEEEYKNWVQLARLNSQYFAEMVLEGLHSKKIPAVIKSETGHFGQTGQMGVAFRPVGGGYSLYVPYDFIKDANNEAAVILGEEWEKSKLIDID